MKNEEQALEWLTVDNRLLNWFAYSHLPTELHETANWFCELATNIYNEIEPGPERTIALRKLLEAKDAAVRARLRPGG